MRNCIYHCDKVNFDKVRKDLQKAKILPRKLSARLAMAVCSCRKRGTSLDGFLEDDISSKRFIIYDEINLPKWEAFPETKRYIEDLLDTFNMYNICVSREKFVHVFYNALNNNFDALKEEMKNGTEEGKKAQKKHKLNEIGLAKLIKRKQKTCPVKGEITLPIFGGNGKKLEEQTGKGFCKTGKQFDCVVRFESDKTREFMNAKKAKTVVTIWCKSREYFTQIQHHLENLSNSIQSEITKDHEKELRRRHVQYEMYKAARQHSTPSSYSTYYYHESNQKEKLSDDYEKKRNRDVKYKTYHHVNKEESSPLAGGHCLHCSKPYDSLKTQANEECRYHSGYQKYYSNSYNSGFEWTCCGCNFGMEKASYEMHNENGCQYGRHVWRPHQKASRGEKTEKLYWQRILKRK